MDKNKIKPKVNKEIFCEVEYLKNEGYLSKITVERHFTESHSIFLIKRLSSYKNKNEDGSEESDFSLNESIPLNEEAMLELSKKLGAAVERMNRKKNNDVP